MWVLSRTSWLSPVNWLPTFASDQPLSSARRTVASRRGCSTRIQPWLKCADGLTNRVPLGRVVHVDVVLVGEAELDDAEQVLRAGRLRGS